MVRRHVPAPSSTPVVTCLATALAVVLVSALGAACGSVSSTRPASQAGIINAVGAENEYADVISQIGGRWVHLSSILNDPSADPHSFETSPSVAREVASADLIVQNGLGYDDFMTKIESSAGRAGRKVIVVQKLLGFPANRPNPHVWYDPRTMPALAQEVAADLSARQPSHAADFQANLRRFDDSLTPWTDAIAAFKASHPGETVATTEPVADDLLDAMGITNSTPQAFQTNVMNGIDPAPQDISLVDGLFTHRRVKALCYNRQVVDAVTASVLDTAGKNGVPVVAVYETMPTPGFQYQSWMLAETEAIQRAVTDGTSTDHL